MSNFDLTNETIDTGLIADSAIFDEKLLGDLLEGLFSKDDKTRKNCFEVILEISKNEPQFLYSKWDYFQELLGNSNNYSKYISVYILAQLTAVDVDNKFETIFDEYFALLGGTRTMISSHVALNSSIIFHNKPKIRAEIVDMLLDIDNLHHGKQVELVKSYVIQALQDIYPDYEDKERIEGFVKNNMDSKSPKTRDTVQSFLKSIE